MWPDGRKNVEKEREEKEKSGGEEDGSFVIAVAEEAMGLPHGDVRGRVPAWPRRTEISSD
jgi:hypothetical protein